MANAFEFTYNLLTIGGNSSYPVLSVEGLYDSDARLESDDKALDHGAFIYAQFAGPKTIVIEGEYMANDPVVFQLLKSNFRAAFALRSSDLPLGFNFPGQPEEKKINCRRTRIHMPVDPQYSIGYGKFTLELIAGDPRIYGVVTNSATLSTKTIRTAGDFPTYPVITIVGAATPVLRNATYNKTFALNGPVTGTTVIDFARRVVTVNGVKRYDLVDQRPTPQWWDLQPGYNVIEHTGGGAATIEWRDAWC